MEKQGAPAFGAPQMHHRPQAFPHPPGQREYPLLNTVFLMCKVCLQNPYIVLASELVPSGPLRIFPGRGQRYKQYLRFKKAERRRIDAFKLWCWRRLLVVPWAVRRFNQTILKEISPEYSLEGLMLKLKLQYFDHLIQRAY